MADSTRCQGLFVGLITLDFIYRVQHTPQANQKIVASDYVVAAGGPATNAAIAFQSLSQSSAPLATVLTVLGCHPMGQMVQVDVEQWGVTIADLQPTHAQPVPTSSVMVTEATGERAVVSLNAVKCRAQPDQIPAHILEDVWPHLGVVLIDGHQMAVGEAIAHRANQENLPVVVDAGSWKPGFETVLRYADYVICSANFLPPDCTTSLEVYHYLSTLGVPHIAITHGAETIEYWHQDQFLSIPAPQVSPVDTLGAGDIFHGAFCYYLLQALQGQALQEQTPKNQTGGLNQHLPLKMATQNRTAHKITAQSMAMVLKQSSQIASRSCQFFGPRNWINTHTGQQTSGGS